MITLLKILNLGTLPVVLSLALSHLYQFFGQSDIFREHLVSLYVPLDPTNISTALVSSPLMVNDLLYNLSEGKAKALLRDLVISS